MHRHFLHFGIALSLGILVILVYFPGLHGPYILDDEENIVLNRDVALTQITSETLYDAAWSNQSGPLKRPIAALSFSLNHYFAGNFDNTLPFKLTNVVIHLINGWLIYYLSLLLLRRPAMAKDVPREYQAFIAGFTALLWSLHPIQLTNVLYVVQRMNSLSALFVILGLIVFLHGRKSLDQSHQYGIWIMLGGIGGGTLLGIGAKENAVLLPLFSLVIEIIFFDRNSLSVPFRKKLGVFYLITLLVPLIIFLGYIVVHTEFLFDMYAMRSFSPYERLLTETRVLWFYLGLLFLPGIQQLGLFHDDITVSTGLLDPLITFPAAMGLLAILVFAILKFRQYPVICFAILWFLAGHSLESSIIGLEIAYEHRNYLPSFGIFLAASYFLFHIFFRHKNHKSGIILVLLSCSVITVFAFSTWTWANVWKDPMSLALHHVNHHPHSVRSISYATNILILEKNDLAQAIRYTVDGIRLSPNESGLHLDMQLYLAYLAFEINSELARKKINIPGRSFQIPNLPESVMVKNVAGKIELSYSLSGPDMINRMLRENVISVHGVVSLEKLAKCITDGILHCQSLLPDVRAWLATAATNPHTTTEYKAIINARASRLYAHTQDYERALEYITAACHLFPDSAYYQLSRAEYLIRLGQPYEADIILDRIEKSEVALRKNRETINLLRKAQTDYLKTGG